LAGVHRLKADVAREMERLRAAGVIGSSLEAEVTIYADEPLAGALSALATSCASC
jgi:hypothetical protein